jgi:hypothetical protein
MAEEQVQEQEIEVGVLSMSDEDLLNMSPQEFIAAQQKDEDEKEEPGQEEEEAPAEEESNDVEAPEVEEEPEEEEQEETPDPTDVYASAQQQSEEEPEESEEVETSDSEVPQNGVDYKAEYEKLLRPFRASKRDIQIKNVDDARNLMQMGVDYTIKMQALKPKLRMMRALDKNGLLDEDRINFFIDLEKKNPEAIKQFLKEKEIDPMELDLDSESQYRPGSYAPSEQEQAIDDVLDSIRDTKSFDRTIDELGNKWDTDSKEILTKQPQLIKLINDQIDTGIYDQIMNVVTSERMLGRLEGLNDLLAYKTVGDALQASGAFDHLKQESKPKRKPSQDPKLKARKRAASPTKRSSRVQPSPNDFNPLALSDEEFEKMSVPKFA